MKMNIKQLSQVLNYTPQGTRKLLKRLQIPLQIGQQQQFDTEQDHPLARSIHLKIQYPHLQAIYTIKDLAQKYQKSKGTILNTLRRTNITLHGAGRKKFVYLSDLRQLEKQMGKK